MSDSRTAKGQGTGQSYWMYRLGRTRNANLERLLIVSVCALLATLAGCGEDRYSLGTMSLPPSMKGYELYSWQAGHTWVFRLMVGTNRLKTIDEVMGDEASTDWALTARGAAELKAALDQLPQGALVSWRGPEALDRMGMALEDLALPPREVIGEVAAHAEHAGVMLEVLQ